MATTQQIDHDDELAMQQFHNADHYQDHDGVTPYPEWYEVGQKAPAQNQPAPAAPGQTSLASMLTPK